MLHKLTGKECRTARSLLKWNVQDLANRTHNVSPRRINDFERGLTPLLGWENTELVTAFTDAKIVFTSQKVMLPKGGKTEARRDRIISHGEGAYITLDADLNILTDTSIGKTATSDPAITIDPATLLPPPDEEE